MRYLFWNTHRNKDINPVLRDLIVDNKITIVVLAEYAANADELKVLLDLYGIPIEQYITDGCERIHIFGKSRLNIEPLHQTDYSSLQLINNETILCCVHLGSKIYSDELNRREIQIEQIIQDIVEMEKELECKNTIVVGDFNINPYDQSCINARYFHGIPYFKEAIRNSRKVAGKEYLMFYNPMWNFLGDFKEPYGTYYKNSGDSINTYWNIYDQVIIRPALRNRFVDENLQILTGTRTMSLLDEKGHPNIHISDHLPIVFEIKEN